MMNGNVELPDICWLDSSMQYRAEDDLCPACATAVAASEPDAIVMGGDPARECDSLATCVRCDCPLSCTVGDVEIYTAADWQEAAHIARIATQRGEGK